MWNQKKFKEKIVQFSWNPKFLKVLWGQRRLLKKWVMAFKATFLSMGWLSQKPVSKGGFYKYNLSHTPIRFIFLYWPRKWNTILHVFMSASPVQSLKYSILCLWTDFSWFSPDCPIRGNVVLLKKTYLDIEAFCLFCWPVFLTLWFFLQKYHCFYMTSSQILRIS